MRAAVVDCQHLDVFVVAPAVDLLVLDAQVRKVDLVVEVREVVVVRPFFNLMGLSIGPAVAVPIPFMKPLLVLALELVVEDDMVDARALFD